jgi:hypothetical protein
MNEINKQINKIEIRECAACIKLNNLNPTKGASHGLCKFHFTAQLNELKIKEDELTLLINKIELNGGFCPEIK